MTTQLSMFEEVRGLGGLRFTPSVRLCSPETSAAAAALNKSTRTNDRARALELLERSGEDGLTDYELATLMDRQQNSAGKRRHELVQLGLVEWAGFHRPAPSGAPCRVWRVTNV